MVRYKEITMIQTNSLIPLNTGIPETLDFTNKMEVNQFIFTSVEQNLKYIEQCPLSEKSINDVIRMITQDVYREKNVKDFKLSRIDINYELNQFLNEQTSVKTRKSYKESVTRFMNYCLRNNIDFIKVDVKNVDGYLNYLCSQYSSRTVRLYMMGVCSFFTFLCERYPECFFRNPFHHRKLPKIKDKFQKDMITENDLNELKRKLKELKRYDIITVIDLIVKYGFRVGFFENLKIRENGEYISVSKGKEIKGKFTQKEVKSIKKWGVLNISVSTIQKMIRKYSTTLFKEGKCTSSFSVHDIRRYFLKTGVEKCKNGFELNKFSKQHHSDIKTTMGYFGIS
jgi:integrase